MPIDVLAEFDRSRSEQIDDVIERLLRVVANPLREIGPGFGQRGCSPMSFGGIDEEARDETGERLLRRRAAQGSTELGLRQFAAVVLNAPAARAGSGSPQRVATDDTRQAARRHAFEAVDGFAN